MTDLAQRMALLLLLSSPSCVAAAAVAPAQSPIKNVAATSRGQAYRSRVEAISRDILWSNAQLLNAFEHYEDAQDAAAKPRRGTDAQVLKADIDSSKAALLNSMKTVRSNAMRLRAISPVPRAWKRLDDDLVEAAWEWSSSLDLMDLWMLHPSGALKLESAKHSRRAQTLLDNTRRDLWALTDRTVTSKKYED